MRAPRFALAIVAAVVAVASAALWVPLGEPLRWLRGTLPAGAFVGSLALSAILFVLRRPLQAATTRLTTALPIGFLVPPLLATAMFALSWAGSHGDRANEVGFIPQLLFPAVSGIFAFSVARYGASLQRGGALWFRARDVLGARVRFVLLIVLTSYVSQQLARTLGKSDRALNEQLLVVVGMLAGYLLLAPRTRAPLTGGRGRGAAATAALALLLAGGIVALFGGQAAAATPACPATVGRFNLHKGPGQTLPRVETRSGPTGGFTLGCFYTEGSGNFDPIISLGDLTGPSAQVFWREAAGSDQYSQFECRGGSFAATTTFQRGAMILGSASRRAFVAYQANASPADTPRFAALAQTLLASVEPSGIPCAAAVAPSATAQPTTTARGLAGAIDLTFTGAVNGRLTELAAVPRCGADATFGTGFYGFILRAKLGNDVYEFGASAPKGTSTPKKYVVSQTQVSVGGPTVYVNAPGASTTGAPVVGKEWASSTSGVGTVTVADENSGSVDITLGPPVNAPAGTPALRVSGTWRCGGVAVVPVVPPPVTGGGTVGGGAEGGGDIDLVASLVSLGLDPGLAGDIADAITDTGIPITASLVSLVTTLIAAGLASGGAAAGVATGVAVAAGGPVPVAPPPTSGILDPYTGKELPRWEPGKYGPGADGRVGQAGDLWFQGNWVTPAYASDQIAQSVAADHARAKELDDGEFARGTTEEREKWLKAKADEQKQIDADQAAKNKAADDADRADKLKELQKQLDDDLVALGKLRADTAHYENIAAGFQTVLSAADHGVAFLKGWVPGGNYYGYAYDVLKGVARGSVNGDWEHELQNAAVDVGKDFLGNAAQDGVNGLLRLGWKFRTDLPAGDVSTMPIGQVVKKVWQDLPTFPEGEPVGRLADYGKRLMNTDATRHMIQWTENEMANYLTGEKHIGEGTMKGIVEGFGRLGDPGARTVQDVLAGPHSPLKLDFRFAGGSPYAV